MSANWDITLGSRRVICGKVRNLSHGLKHLDTVFPSGFIPVSFSLAHQHPTTPAIIQNLFQIPSSHKSFALVPPARMHRGHVRSLDPPLKCHFLMEVSLALLHFSFMALTTNDMSYFIGGDYLFVIWVLQRT